MWPDWVSNPGPLTYESGALPIALRGPAFSCNNELVQIKKMENVVSLSQKLYWSVTVLSFNSTITTFNLLEISVNFMQWKP